MRRRRVAVLVAAACLTIPVAARAAPAHAATNFVGVVADGPMLDPSFDLARELRLVKASRVRKVRATFAWSAAQPYRSFDDLPPGPRGRWSNQNGVPTDFSATDRLVDAAARRGIDVLPVVLYSPAWAAAVPYGAGPPKSPKPYARYVAALARRYGSNGSYWRRHPGVPRRPIRDWQVWNEPNIAHYWPKPFARGYVKMLRTTRSALRAADPRARLVLAGLTNDSWTALVKIYRAGGRRYFDVVAVHPYTRNVRGLVKILAYVRYGMKRFHDERKPIVVTELSWPSAAGQVEDNGFNEVTESQQADRVRDAFGLLARYRRHFRIEGVYWYTWLSIDSGPDYFSYAGLRKMTPDGPVSKPAFEAFRVVARRLGR